MMISHAKNRPGVGIQCVACSFSQQGNEKRVFFVSAGFSLISNEPERMGVIVFHRV